MASPRRRARQMMPTLGMDIKTMERGKSSSIFSNSAATMVRWCLSSLTCIATRGITSSTASVPIAVTVRSPRAVTISSMSLVGSLRLRFLAQRSLLPRLRGVSWLARRV